MTLRQYWTDAYAQTFSAEILDITLHQDKPAVVLDQTLFYPSAGGQPHDTGTLAGVDVLDVVAREDGDILHVVAASSPLLKKGERVQGGIHWQRRFDHMQQHSGQHILSQAFALACQLETVAVHIGDSFSTLDIAANKLSAEHIEKTEHEANRVVFANLPINIYDVGFDELSRVPLRKPPQKSAGGKVRIVEIEQYDWSACGGTHVRHTGEVGLIKILGVEKRGNEARISFRCGWRAVHDYATLNNDVATVGTLLSAGRYEWAAAVQRLRAEFDAEHAALVQAQMQLLDIEAQRLLADPSCQTEQGKKVVAVFAENKYDATQLKLLAKLLTTAQPNVVAVLASAGEKSALCFARSKDAPGNMGDLLKQALAQLGGKGGGSADFAQGGGQAATVAQLQLVLGLVNN